MTSPIFSHWSPFQIMRESNSTVAGVEIRFIMCAIYLLLGMALIAMCFNLMQVSEHSNPTLFNEWIQTIFQIPFNLFLIGASNLQTACHQKRYQKMFPMRSMPMSISGTSAKRCLQLEVIGAEVPLSRQSNKYRIAIYVDNHRRKIFIKDPTKICSRINHSSYYKNRIQCLNFNDRKVKIIN